MVRNGCRPRAAYRPRSTQEPVGQILKGPTTTSILCAMEDPSLQMLPANVREYGASFRTKYGGSDCSGAIILYCNRNRADEALLGNTDSSPIPSSLESSRHMDRHMDRHVGYRYRRTSLVD